MSPSRSSPSWRVYVLRCGDGTLYTGVTTDLERRLAAHARGRGARYTRGRGPFTVVLVEEIGRRGDALRRELALKALSRREKLALIRASVIRASRPARAAARRP